MTDVNTALTEVGSLDDTDRDPVPLFPSRGMPPLWNLAMWCFHERHTFWREKRTYVEQCRDEGVSWGDIADAMGTTKQAAQQWFDRQNERAAAEYEAYEEGSDGV